MLRVVLLNLLLFLLPLAIYVVIVMMRRPGTSQDSLWRDAPLIALFSAGTILVVVVMVLFVSFSGAPKGGVYKPAEIRDGQLIPGHIERE